MNIFLNIQTMGNMTIFYNSSTKKVILSEYFKCSLHVKQHIVMFVLFCNKIIIVPMKSVSSGVRLQATYSCVSLAVMGITAL